MQPPPRKTKHSASHLKGIHSDQISKLQHKHQHEIDTLEDVRLFTKQRAAIEKEYAQSLCKLAQQYLSKGKFPPTPNIGSEDGQEYKTMSEVWRTVLDETDRVGKIRLQAADTYLQQISEPVKPIKTSKTTVAKKVFEQIKLLQKEIDQAVTELAKSQKVYNDDEHVSHEAVLKATEAESKVKNKSTGIFTSLAKLQQTSAKLNLRMENCQVKSTSARNEYLLNLAATNTHLERYFVSELPELVKLLDGEMYDKIRDFFITLSKMEVDCCGLTQERFMKILTDSTMVSRQFDHQCFLHTNTIFTDKVQYSFEPQENDQVSKVSAEHTAADQLHAEARKWALRAARDARTIRQLHVKIDNLKHRSMNGGSKSGSSEPSSPTTSPVDTDARLDELQIAARKADTSKRKAEARLAAMREGGIDTASAISSAQEEVDAEVDEGDESRPQSQSDAPVVPPTDSTYVNYQDDDYDDSYAATATTTAATAATDEADAATDATSQQQEGSLGYASLGQGLPLRAQALYDFVASNTDELDIKENETVDVIGDGDGDGWVQARNMSGKVGFVPQNYLQYTDTTNPDPSGPGVDPNEMNVDADQAPLSAGYGSAPPSAGYDATAPSTDTLGSTGAEKVSNYSSTDYEVQATIHPPTELNTGPPGSTWARALYDFEATSEEELSFSEGQLIRVTQKDENGVDDGWWRGELGGKVGVFPSLVVEELSKEEMSAQDLASPNRPGPPAFTPPEPGPPPPQLEVTQPTPSDESGPTMAESSTPNGVTPSPPHTPQPKCSPTSATQLTGHSPGRIESTV